MVSIVGLCFFSESKASGIEEQGMGWKSDFKSGKGADAITSGLEVIWTATPTKWNHMYFRMLFDNEWELTKSPAGANQWVAKDVGEIFPDAFDSEKKHRPTMLTTDLSLRFDPVYEKISKEFYDNPEKFDDAFAKAWFKLTHRDMGPSTNYLGPEVPEENFVWQDPIPPLNHQLISNNDISALKKLIMESGLSISELVSTAWASASTFRGSDNRGGANGARIRLSPQNDWEVNKPKQLNKVLTTLGKIQKNFNSKYKKKEVSMADLIVLGGCAAIEKAAKKGGNTVKVPFQPGRMDASQDQTDINSVGVLEPIADGFRNYIKDNYIFTTEELLIDKAQLLTLTAPEMTVLLGGMRVLNTNYDNSRHGVLTNKPETLTNDYFVNLLDMNIQWTSKNGSNEEFEGRERKSGNMRWTATRADLIFGSNSELRALAEVYASNDAKSKFIDDFVSSWDKVMSLDRFDL